jgi:hypothetical protein
MLRTGFCRLGLGPGNAFFSSSTSWRLDLDLYGKSEPAPLAIVYQLKFPILCYVSHIKDLDIFAKRSILAPILAKLVFRLTFNLTLSSWR